MAGAQNSRGEQMKFISEATKQHVLVDMDEYAFLRKHARSAVESLHDLVDELHQTLSGGPLMMYRPEDWDLAIKHDNIDPRHRRMGQRARNNGMLSVTTDKGMQRHYDIVRGLVYATVHNRVLPSAFVRFLSRASGIKENSVRVGFDFLESTNERLEKVLPLPWDPDYPLEIIRSL